MKTKMMMSALLLIISTHSFAQGDRAGSVGGNGGDVLVCPGKELIMLDTYQGQESWGFKPLVLQGHNRRAMIIEALKGLQRVDSPVASLYLKRALEIESEMTKLENNPTLKSNLVKLSDKELLNIPDEGFAEIPVGCKIEQAATQIRNRYPNEAKFTFQKQLWQQMTTQVQATLILHEVLYEAFIQIGRISSRDARYLNSALLAGRMQTGSDYLNISSLFGYENILFTTAWAHNIWSKRTIGLNGLCNFELTFNGIGELSFRIRIGKKKVVKTGFGKDLNQLRRSAFLKFEINYASKGECD